MWPVRFRDGNGEVLRGQPNWSRRGTSFGRNHMKRDAAGPVRWRQAVEPSGGSRVFEPNMVRLWSAGRGARLGLESPSAGRRTHRLMRGEAERREGLRPAYA